MEIKAIALDLDGTLLTTDKKISELNKNILKELERKGIKIFIVTGRTYKATKPFADELGLINSDLILYNGAKVINTHENKVIYELPLESSYTKKIIKLARERKIHLNLYQNNNWFVENDDNEETKYYSQFTKLTPIVKNFDTFEDYSMTKVTVQNMEFSSEFDDFCNEIKKIFANNVYTAKSHNFLFEILNKNVNKGITLEKILKKYNISINECVAFGDALNDLEMLTMVKYGVAMGNSSLDLKTRVNYVTDTNDNNGVAKFLKKYFF